MGADPMTDFSISLEIDPKSNDSDEIPAAPRKDSAEEKVAISSSASTSSTDSRVQGFQDIPETAAFRMAVAKIGVLLSVRQQKHLMNELFEKRACRFTSSAMPFIYRK